MACLLGLSAKLEKGRMNTVLAQWLRVDECEPCDPVQGVLVSFLTVNTKSSRSTSQRLPLCPNTQHYFYLSYYTTSGRRQLFFFADNLRCEFPKNNKQSSKPITKHQRNHVNDKSAAFSQTPLEYIGNG